MNKGIKYGVQGGFTLIELIVVIVILGILAATAIPRFTGLTGDARMAALEGARGSVMTAAAMYNGRFLINGQNTITVGNQTITMVNGYPNAGSIGIAAGLGQDFDVVPNGAQALIRPRNLPANLNGECSLAYQEATPGNPPQVTRPTRCE